MRYARFIHAGDQIRTVDVVDMAAYEPLPDWYTTDDAFLEHIFAPQLVEKWWADSQWFEAVPAGVQEGASFTGTDYIDPHAYLNPDGTDGSGAAP